jgi:lysophospholipase L1-like esterase
MDTFNSVGKDYRSRRGFIKAASLVSLGIMSLPGLSTAAKYPEDKNLVFLFQGDSITDGNRGRNEDPNHIMGHGYAFSIASRVGADFPEKNPKFYNRGISGNKITDLQARWQKDTLDLKPDVLSVLIGVNDTHSVVEQNNAVPAEQYEEVYQSLITKTKQELPNVLLVFCEPFILPVGRVKEKWEAWHSDIVKRQEIVKKLAVQEKAVFVGFQQVFDKASKTVPLEYWMWDGIHPTVAGHELMAREWLAEVGKKLPFLKKYSKG